MDGIKKLVDEQKEYFSSGKTKELEFRLERLRTLRKAVEENEDEIMNALKEDLNKSPFESYATEIGFVLDEIKYYLKQLPGWVKRKRVKTPLMHFLSSSYIYTEPYGITLIISPWNYPFQLALVPLIGSIAAGNCAIIKPSEYSPNTSAIIEKIISGYFEKSHVAVVQGGVEVSKELLKRKFDYIFFTGSTTVGKKIMKAAAEHLTPVTLELGGKSPCIVGETADLKLAARRTVWGKFLNAGQTCVAPDYIMVQRCVKEKFIKNMKEYIIEFYGTNSLQNDEYPKIINADHFQRLIGLMNSGNIVYGGRHNEQSLKIEPTIIDNVSWDSVIMEEEIFGPLLPILEFDDLEDVVRKVNQKPKPLALYLFTTEKKREEYILESISFGGGCINDTIVHLASQHMPFGGVGESGIGSYHGKNSFDTFSHKKSIMKKSNLFDIPLRYPPYKKWLSLLKKIMG